MFRKSETIKRPEPTIIDTKVCPDCSKKYEEERKVPTTFGEMWRDPLWRVVIKKSFRSAILRLPLFILSICIVLSLGEYLILQDAYVMPLSIFDIEPFVIFLVGIMCCFFTLASMWYFIDKNAIRLGLAKPGEMEHALNPDGIDSSGSSFKPSYTHDELINSRSLANPSTGLSMSGSGMDVGGHGLGSSRR